MLSIQILLKWYNMLNWINRIKCRCDFRLKCPNIRHLKVSMWLHYESPGDSESNSLLCVFGKKGIYNYKYWNNAIGKIKNSCWKNTLEMISQGVTIWGWPRWTYFIRRMKIIKFCLIVTIPIVILKSPWCHINWLCCKSCTYFLHLLFTSLSIDHNHN